MGRRTKKLREWCRFEFGTGVGDAPGNCHACVKHFKRAADDVVQMKVRRAEITGVIPEEIRAEKVVTPCRACPKWQLYPDNYGLMPANERAVELYRYAIDEKRFSTMEGAYLNGTVTPQGVLSVLAAFSYLFATYLDREHMLEKIMIVDEMSTRVRGKAEESRRESRRAQLDAERNNSGREVR